MRQPIVAGQFYPKEEDELRAQIKGFLGNVKDKAIKQPLALISPHAGFMFSGQCASYGYSQIDGKRRTFILLGLSHNGYPSSISLEDWKTPLGVMENDIELSKAINLPVDEEAHRFEHSIEVQLPFLQVISPGSKIVPVIASPDLPFQEIADKIFGTIKTTKRDVMIIASSDFTHFGANYGYLPFRDNIKENLKKLDTGAIQHIKNLDPASFLDYTEKTGATICGRYPIAVALSLSKMLGAKKSELIHYTTSGELTGDFSNSVSYASIKIF